MRRPRRSTLFPTPPLSRSEPECVIPAAILTHVDHELLRADALDQRQEVGRAAREIVVAAEAAIDRAGLRQVLDRKSTRLNSSHSQSSYAVFCLEKTNAHTL